MKGTAGFRAAKRRYIQDRKTKIESYRAVLLVE